MTVTTVFIVLFLVNLLYLSLYWTGLLHAKNKFVVDGRTVLITGGSQGVGRALAKLLSEKGANVIIIARDVSRLEEAISYISASAKRPSSQRFHYIKADVTKHEENIRIMAEATLWNGEQPPDIVWANAGACIPKFFMECSVEDLRAQMDLNYWAAAYLARATLNQWLTLKSPNEAKGKDRLPRHFVMTSSVVAFVAVAGYTPYTVAKAAMRSLADSLRAEVNIYNGSRLHPTSIGPSTDIKIHTLFGGSIQTPGLDQENKIKHPVTKQLEEGDPIQSEDEVAAIAVRSLEKGHQLVTTQYLASAMRASALGGSPRNSWILDTVLSWVTSIVWLFYQPYMDRTVFRYGMKYGVN